MCSSNSVCLPVRIAFNSNNQISARSRPTSSSCIVRVSKENQSLQPGGSLHFFLACKTPLPIRFNWKVMKFLFKEIIQVYEDRLVGETQDSLISVQIYTRVESPPIQNEKCLARSQCPRMKLPGFYISSAIWVLLPQQLMSQLKWFHLSLRGILQFTQKICVIWDRLKGPLGSHTQTRTHKYIYKYTYSISWW